MANHRRRIESRRAEKQRRRDTEFTAAHRWARISSRKVRLVADQIRGMNVNRALEALKFSPKRGAALLSKVVRSALSSAEYAIGERKLDLDLDDLCVRSVLVDEGPTLKRWMTRARGSAYPILHRTCHIQATLGPREELEEDTEGPAADKAAKIEAIPAGGAAGKSGRKKAAKAGA